MRATELRLDGLAGRFGGCAALALVLVGGTAVAQTTWSSAVDGTWGDASKWSAGVPNNNVANLTANTASYTVTVDAAPANRFADLNVTNGVGNTTTLEVGAGGFKSNDGLITVGRGATVNVNADGAMYYDGSDSTKTIAVIKDGGLWHVNGGTVAFTNLYPGGVTAARTKTISIGPAGSEGTLKITSGDYQLADYAHAGVAGNYIVSIAVGDGSGGRGKLEMTGGSLTMAGSQNAYNSYFKVGGAVGSYGEVRLSGSAMLMTSNQFDVGRGGTGVVSLADNAVLRQTVICRGAIGDRSGSMGTISVSDNATLDMNSASAAINLGGYTGGQGGGTGIISFANSSTGLFNIAYVGVSGLAAKTGYGEINLSGGLVRIGNSMIIGYGYVDNANGIGVVTVTGGTLYLAQDNGITLGSARDATYAANGAYGRGTLHLSGNGLVYNLKGYARVGFYPGSVGLVNQTGGRFVIDHTTTARPMYIGNAGGDGTYRISGGVFSSRNWVFVGGATGDGGSGSQGLLEITGGSFGVTNTLFVGQNGTGRIEIGPAGALYASSLDLQGSTSTLRFECGPNGVGSCTVAGALTVGSGAKLEVDASLFEPAATTDLVLVQYDSRTAPFASGDVTLVSGARPAEILQSDTQVVLRVVGVSGTVLTIR